VHSQLITARELEELGNNREAIFNLGIEKLQNAIDYVKEREVDWQEAGIILEEILEKMVRNVEKSAELILYAEDGSIQNEDSSQIEQGEEEFENAGALGAGLLLGGLGGLALGSYLGGYRWGGPYGYYGYPVYYGPRIHRHYYAYAKASSNVESSDAGLIYGGGFGYPGFGYPAVGYGGYGGYGFNPWLNTYYTPGVARRISRRTGRRVGRRHGRY
jgi:hypothetical protein